MIKSEIVGILEHNRMKKAIVIGATSGIGNELVQTLFKTDIRSELQEDG
jgi:NADP-dependent 3-hydroxy acid dehydrogenase YdfG